MNSEERKAAITAYKERKKISGIYLIRCTASGQLWVGQWPDLETIQTRLWFTLKHGGHPNKDLTAAWKTHGEAEFRFEILEKLENEELLYIRNAKLKDRAAYWRDHLTAATV